MTWFQISDTIIRIVQWNSRQINSKVFVVLSLSHFWLQSHGRQLARLPCSLYPGVCSKSCPLSRWCQLIISLSPSSPPALNLSQHQSLSQSDCSSHQLAKVLELQLQHQSFQWILRVHFLKDWLVWSLCGRLSRVFCSVTIWKQQFFGAQPLWSNSHIHTWLLEKS